MTPHQDDDYGRSAEAERRPRVPSPPRAQCAHMHVNYLTSTDKHTGLTMGWWECLDCATHFVPAPSVSPPSAVGTSPEAITPEWVHRERLYDTRMAAAYHVGYTDGHLLAVMPPSATPEPSQEDVEIMEAWLEGTDFDAVGHLEGQLANVVARLLARSAPAPKETTK